MTIKLTLDTKSVRDLIAANPEFELEVRQCVLNNIKSDNIEEAVKSRLETALKGMCEQSGGFYSGKLKITDPKLLEAMRVVVSETVNALASGMIHNQISDMVEQERSKLRSEMNKVVRELAKETLMQVITPEMAKEILLQKIM